MKRKIVPPKKTIINFNLLILFKWKIAIKTHPNKIAIMAPLVTVRNNTTYMLPINTTIDKICFKYLFPIIKPGKNNNEIAHNTPGTKLYATPIWIVPKSSPSK